MNNPVEYILAKSLLLNKYVEAIKLNIHPNNLYVAKNCTNIPDSDQEILTCPSGYRYKREVRNDLNNLFCFNKI